VTTNKRAILLDIEGTTTPIAFVTETLLPYARAHLHEFLEREGRGGEAARYLALMDRDSKSPDLKELQGRIWEEGHKSGALAGHVFADVPRAFARWRDAHIPIGIYSSGSVLAQQTLFRTCAAGDLTTFIRWYFDTEVGGKRESASYARIAERVGLPARAITFVSDVAAELDAARAAGMRTVLSVRPGNAPQPPHDHPTITTFDQLEQA
jgi:enolase-phosphatase E1